MSFKSADGRFEYLDKDGEELKPTALENVGRFQYECRSQPNSHCSVNLGKNAGYQVENRNWLLTGTVSRPTITPSINCTEAAEFKTVCWHGFIKEGIFLNTANEIEEKQ